MRFSSNPAINRLNRSEDAIGSADAATYTGVALKALFYVALVFASALLITVYFPQLLTVNPGSLLTLLFVSMIGALVFGIAASLAPKTAMITGSIYAICEGLLIGVVSMLFEAAYSGIVLGALLSTVVTFGVVMLLYTSETIRVTSKMRRIVLISIISVIVSQLLFWLVSAFVPALSEAFYNNFGLQLGICILMILLGAFMLLIDLDNITKLVQNRIDKRYEWVAAFGLVVTLIWLYLQFLRLLALISSRR